MPVASRRLRELADTDLSYPGWEKDYEEASEACQIGTIRVFERLFHEIKEKQRAFDNHHILIRIEIIHGLGVSYPGYGKDKVKVEEWCRENPVNEETQEKFEEKLQGLVNKHALYDGDRSHPNLVALDECNFTFPGWEDEYENAVRAHCDEPFTKFPKLLHQLKEKQHRHDGKRIHWRLKTLDELELSYPGCEKDIAEVETWHYNTSDSPSNACLFREAIDGLLEQEEIYLEAQMEEANEMKSQVQRGIFIDQRQINRAKREAKQTRDPISDPVGRRTPTPEELYRAKIREMEERKAREEHEKREALKRQKMEEQKRQEMFRSQQMNHSRHSINNFVQRSAPRSQNHAERSSHIVAPTKSQAQESTVSLTPAPTREALKRQEMFRNRQMSHSRGHQTNNHVQRSAAGPPRTQNNEMRSSPHLMAPTQSHAEESVVSDGGSSAADSVDIEVDECYRRIAATLKMLEENQRIREEIDKEDQYRHPHHHAGHHNASSHHSRTLYRPVRQQTGYYE